MSANPTSGPSAPSQAPVNIQQEEDFFDESPISRMIFKVCRTIEKHLPHFVTRIPVSLYNRLSSSPLTAPIRFVYHHLFGTKQEKMNGGIGEDLDDNIEFEEDPADVLIGNTTLHNTGTSCYASTLWSLCMLIDEIRDVLSLNTENSAPLDPENAEPHKTLDGKSDPSKISLQYSKEEYEIKSLEKQRVEVVVTSAIEQRLLEIIKRAGEKRQQDILEVVDPLLDELIGMIKKNGSQEMQENWITKLDIILKNKNPISEEITDHKYDKDTFGAVLGDDGENEIIPCKDTPDLSSWMKSYFPQKPSAEDTTSNKEGAYGQYHHAPPFVVVKVQRTINANSKGKDIGTAVSNNNFPFKTPRKIAFQRDVQYIEGEDQVLYRRVGCAVHQGKIIKTSSGGHFFAYLEKTNGQVFCHDDLNPKPSLIKKGTFAYQQYIYQRDHNALVYFYKKTHLKNSATPAS